MRSDRGDAGATVPGGDWRSPEEARAAASAEAGQDGTAVDAHIAFDVEHQLARCYETALECARDPEVIVLWTAKLAAARSRAV